jgi:hypothetical protein
MYFSVVSYTFSTFIDLRDYVRFDGWHSRKQPRLSDMLHDETNVEL